MARPTRPTSPRLAPVAEPTDEQAEVLARAGTRPGRAPLNIFSTMVHNRRVADRVVRLGGAFLGIYPGLDFEMLPLAFAVVIIGGMGSLGGAAIGALLVGLADNFGKALFPEVSYFTLYAPMALILAVKPTGLFGRE